MINNFSPKIKVFLFFLFIIPNITFFRRKKPHPLLFQNGNRKNNHFLYYFSQNPLTNKKKVLLKIIKKRHLSFSPIKFKQKLQDLRIHMISKITSLKPSYPHPPLSMETENSKGVYSRFRSWLTSTLTGSFGDTLRAVRIW